MKLKRIKKENVEIIENVAREIKKLEKGGRNATKVYESTKIDLVNQNLLKEKELKNGENYTFLYIDTRNLGTRKWGDYIKELCQREGVFVGETDCYITIKEQNILGSFDDKKIKKDKLIAIIEE